MALRIDALERLRQDHEYRILVVHGPDQLFPGLPQELRKLGYQIQELNGPDVRAAGFSLDTLIANIEKSDLETHRTIKTTFRDIQDILQEGELPDFVFANYCNQEEGRIAALCSLFVYHTTRPEQELRDTVPLFASISHQNEEALHTAIRIGQAYKLFFYEYTTFIHELSQNGMLSEDVPNKVDHIGEHLDILAHHLIIPNKHKTDLEQEMTALYAELQAYKLMYKPTEQDTLVKELEVRLCLAYERLFHKQLETETSEPAYSGAAIKRRRQVLRKIRHFRRQGDGNIIAVVVSANRGMQNIYIQTTDDPHGYTEKGGMDTTEGDGVKDYYQAQGLFALIGLDAAETVMYLQKLDRGGLHHIIYMEVDTEHTNIPPEIIEAGFLNYLARTKRNEVMPRKPTIQ